MTTEDKREEIRRLMRLIDELEKQMAACQTQIEAINSSIFQEEYNEDKIDPADSWKDAL